MDKIKEALRTDNKQLVDLSKLNNDKQIDLLVDSLHNLKLLQCPTCHNRVRINWDATMYDEFDRPLNETPFFFVHVDNKINHS